MRALEKEWNWRGDRCRTENVGEPPAGDLVLWGQLSMVAGSRFSGVYRGNGAARVEVPKGNPTGDENSCLFRNPAASRLIKNATILEQAEVRGR